MEDGIAPDILRVAVYDRTISTYEQSPRFYSVKKINGVLTTSPSILNINIPKISFAITAYDRYSGSTNKNGIFQAILSENEKPLAGFQMDCITYDETRYLNAHIDYKLHNSGGSYVQHLGYLPGYPNGIYNNQFGNGVVNIEDGLVHPIKISVKDANGNTSILKLNVKYIGPKQEDKKTLAKSDGQKNEFRPGFMNVFENSWMM